MKLLCLVPALLCVAGLAFAQTKKGKSVHKGRSTTATLAGSMKAGQLIYTENCVSCHQVDGGGVQNMNPPLIKTTYILGDKKRIINIVLNGLQHQDIDGDTYQNVMPSFNFLSDKQVAAILTFVRNSFGNKASLVHESDVKNLRTQKL